jgi:tRNA(fMet)-specific endonuclease VapC
VSAHLLDTDACIEIIRGNPAPLEAWPEADFVISTVSRFEIQSGLRGRAGSKREQRAQAFLDAANTLDFNSEAADQAAALRIRLESEGQPIGAYDTLLAGHALALGLPVVTRNGKEFQRVPGLRLLSW